MVRFICRLGVLEFRREFASVLNALKYFKIKDLNDSLYDLIKYIFYVIKEYVKVKLIMYGGEAFFNCIFFDAYFLKKCVSFF